MSHKGFLAVLLVSAALSGCGAAGGANVLSTEPPAVETVTETVTVTASEPPTSTEPTPTEDEAVATTKPVDSPTTIELPSEDRPLGLDDFFNPDGRWEEGRWNVANRTNEQGVSLLLLSRNELELRLQNQFTTLRFDAGQANDSPSSECTTKVDIVVDGELRETREFGFNTIQEFVGVDVRDSNAVKLAVSRGSCNDYVRLVLSRILVE